MFSKGTFVKIIAVVLLAITAKHVFKLVVSFGAFTHNHSHHPGPCRKIQNMQPSSEDFFTLSSGLTFISSGFRIQGMEENIVKYYKKNNMKGRIYLYDLKKAGASAVELKIKSSGEFNADTFAPHGIAVWEDKVKGHHTVFVVNHPWEAEPAADRIEKFVFNPDTMELQHLGYYSDKAITFANEIIPTSENSFYLSNYHYYRDPLRMALEDVLFLRFTDVVYFDGKSYASVANDMVSPNGLALSKDGKYLYVAACLGFEIRVFKRNKDNSLNLVQIYPLQTVPDNIQMDPLTGDLYVGCHAIPHKFVCHIQGNPSEDLAPSQVLQLKTKDGNITSVQEVLYDHGELIAGSTSAIVYDKKLLVGSLLHNTVVCDVNIPL